MKMPTAARQALAFVSNLFGAASTSTATISTELPQNEKKQDNGKVITEQPQLTLAPPQDPMTTPGNKNSTGSPAPLGTKSPTGSNGSSDVSDESIVNWEPDVYEKELVKKTWSDDFDFLYELGAAIYTYIFDNNPNTKELFPSIHKHGDQWRDSKEFRSQALKFVQTLSYTVKNLYHMERAAAHVHKIGELHVKYAKRGFKPEFWNIFLDAMEVSLTDSINRNKEMSEDQKSDAIRVWRRLAHYVIVHMKRGYSSMLNKTEQEKN
ncbi:hypothetical protein FO519_004128 [Halicephalobus sp. NKZ332]|nr:hypothetical protein FO519_004128 [Halicephalobus sp. NKZ332]